MRRLAQVQLLIIDDFALQPMDATATADFYELVVARHHKASTVLTSNRGPDEWLAIMSDPLLAQSAVDRLTSTAHELVIEGQSYRRRQKPSVDTARKTTQIMLPEPNGWSLPPGKPVVPSPWRMTWPLSAPSTTTNIEEAVGKVRPDIVIEATGVGAMVFDAMAVTGSYGIVALTGVSPTGRTVTVDAGSPNREIVSENDAVLG